jgi:hypothetical protein
MADIGSGSGPGESIYTALAFITVLALLAAVGFVWYRGFQVFGGATWFIPG